MKLEFNYIEQAHLPQLSWCVEITKEQNQANVYHGSGIEVFEDYFFEGVWEGEVAKADFDESFFFLGSGAKIINGKILFSTPGHVIERLYAVQKNDSYYVSNSLSFTLSISKTEIDKSIYNYEQLFNSILKGVNQYVSEIPLLANETLELFYLKNFIIDATLNVTISGKNELASFKDFSDYKQAILDYLNKIAENAKSGLRKKKLSLKSTISTGYDAAACAALAKQVGCNEVLTFNAPNKYKNDDGTILANQLGFKKITYANANTYLENKSLVEAEYLSSGELGASIVFSAFEEEFKNAIVLMGQRGDKLWEKNYPNVNNELRFYNSLFPATAQIESRLRVGYIIFPLPLFGATQWVSIAKISHSKELENYSVGGNYDRPIPRKLVEDAGGQRNSFGIKKKGAGFNYRYDNLHRIKKRMAPHSFKHFLEYRKKHIKYPPKRRIQQLKFLWSTKNSYFNYLLLKLGLRIKVKPITADDMSNPGAPLDLFFWAVDVMKKQYQIKK